MNEQSINQVSELCIDLGGTPDVDKNILTGNWSVNCHRPPISVNQ